MEPERKRKKEIPKYPNPLFMHWLEEWKDDAAKNGLKSQYTYAKVSFSKFFIIAQTLVTNPPPSPQPELPGSPTPGLTV